MKVSLIQPIAGKARPLLEKLTRVWVLSINQEHGHDHHQ